MNYPNIANTEEYNDMKQAYLKAQDLYETKRGKVRNKMTHLTPKKKKR